MTFKSVRLRRGVCVCVRDGVRRGGAREKEVRVLGLCLRKMLKMSVLFTALYFEKVTLCLFVPSRRQVVWKAAAAGGEAHHVPQVLDENGADRELRCPHDVCRSVDTRAHTLPAFWVAPTARERIQTRPHSSSCRVSSDLIGTLAPRG